MKRRKGEGAAASQNYKLKGNEARVSSECCDAAAESER